MGDEEDIPRVMELSDEAKEKKREERRQEEARDYYGLEVSSITSNHGMPIQYFRCPWCGERNVGFDLFEGCRNDDCDATFKIIAERNGGDHG